MGDERADYMMEAFLDEQNTLIRPLVSRKLHLVHVLDERASVVEKLLEEKRKAFLQTVVLKQAGTARKAPESAEQIEALEDELEQLSEEKLVVLQQLMDLVKRPYDTILEVEAVLQAATESGGDERVIGSRRSAQAAGQAAVAATVVPEELWCFCRKTDDGRQMVACDNPNCDLVWWHIDCIDRYIAANRIGTKPPEDERKWHCPVCVAQEIVNREHAEGEKIRRRRRT